MIVLLLLLTHCANGPPRPAPIGATPNKSVAVTPKASASAAETAKLRQQVDNLHVTAKRLSTGMDRVVDETKRLRIQKSANEAELETLWKLLAESQTEARNMFKELEVAQEQARLAQQKSDELQMLSVARDLEVDELRKDNAALIENVRMQGLTIVDLQKRLDKATAKAGLADYYNKLTWFVVGFFVIGGFLFFLFRALPLIIAAAKPALLR